MSGDDKIERPVDALMAARGAQAPQQTTSRPACRRCGGPMAPGIATVQTYSTSHEGTCSPAGLGRLMPCLKCSACGHSVSAGAPVAADAPPIAT